ncbi:MAG: TetR/AcrR family transcriptional regulator [Desulfobulbaceae bacterium]|nr:MAG: TetR/AcrR family transcriptional regulator [Desulfobulbaceae bacterium]
MKCQPVICTDFRDLQRLSLPFEPGKPDSNTFRRDSAVVQKRQSTEVRQQQIVDAAAVLIFKYGSEHLTVKRIAAEVGISEAAIYRHFKSKKSILSFLLNHIEEALLKDISSESIANEPVTLDTIERIIRNHFSNIGMRKGISFQIIAEIISLGDRSLNKQASRAINRYIARLKEILADGVRDGAIRPDIDLEAAATLLFSLIQGLVNIWSLSTGTFKLIDTYTSLWHIYREAISRR